MYTRRTSQFLSHATSSISIYCKHTNFSEGYIHGILVFENVWESNLAISTLSNANLQHNVTLAPLYFCISCLLAIFTKIKTSQNILLIQLSTVNLPSPVHLQAIPQPSSTCALSRHETVVTCAQHRSCWTAPPCIWCTGMHVSGSGS